MTTTRHELYIATTADRLWAALTENDVRRQWWRGHTIESDWTPGGKVTTYLPDGRVELTGTILDADRPRLLAYEGTVEMIPDEPSRLTFNIEAFPSMVRLTVSYEAGEKLTELASGGWPAVLSSLKSLLETGRPLPLDEVFGEARPT